MQIGPYQFDNALALAPMAGVTDLPFRTLCRSLGAGMAASEMITSDTRLWHTRKTRLRLDHSGEPEPRIVQIAGGDPDMIANAARLNVERGAQIIDINFGCPAKKVCKKAAGSALLKDESLVRAILEAAVDAVDVPVTMKMRTGWSPEQRNGVSVARIAEDAGVQALAVHGRTRECKFKGHAEFDTIRDIVREVSIPVLANGDITCAESARAALQHTGAAGVMIGRAAQGQPWIFQQILNDLSPDRANYSPISEDIGFVRDTMTNHLVNLYGFYGDSHGVRIARKHLTWYLQSRPFAKPYLHELVRCDTSVEQLKWVARYFSVLITQKTAAA
ncbi:MAG: tRNA dihydrouridine synthase DusB [Pseudomonadota bacterium]